MQQQWNSQSWWLWSMINAHEFIRFLRPLIRRINSFIYIERSHCMQSSKQINWIGWNNFNSAIIFAINVPVNSKTAQQPPPSRAIPGYLTRVKLRTVRNLTQNEAHKVAHLTFLSKRLSAVGNKRISQFFASASEPRSRAIALVDFTWVFFCCTCCRFI